MQIDDEKIHQIQGIHFQLSACDSTQSLYESVLKSINDLLNADHSFFHGINKDKKPVSRSDFGFRQADSRYLSILDKYYDDYYQHDPIYNYLLEHAKANSHVLISPKEFISDDEFEQSNFSQELIKPYLNFIGGVDHILCLLLCDKNNPAAIFFFFREKDKPAFTEQDQTMLELIVAPLIVNVRRIAIQEKVLERDFIISELSESNDSVLSGKQTNSKTKSFGLTERESDVSSLIMEGKTNIVIADELGVSIRTIENHLRAIYKKLNIHNRTALASLMHQ